MSLSLFAEKKADITFVNLKDYNNYDYLFPLLDKADAFIFGTGTYWDSWSHHLQRFFEEATKTEGSSTWLGKPTGVIVTMHAVGGKGVLSRMQGVLNNFGCAIPPMSGMVYSLVNKVTLDVGSEFKEIVWTTDNAEVVVNNVLEALKPNPKYKTWELEVQNFSDRWI
jgi:multimeric flavodoxin WrbA